MTDQFVNANKMVPITPPPELVEKWRNSPEYITGLQPMSMVSLTTDKLQDIATQAARWGADQELEACEKYWMTHGISPEGVVRMREHRRPKPPSLKEQALGALYAIATGADDTREFHQDIETIQAALESLPD